MSHAINLVMEAIVAAGGRIRSRELIEAQQIRGLSRRDIQLAVQTAFDKGLIKLDRDMQLVVATSEVNQAA